MAVTIMMWCINISMYHYTPKYQQKVFVKKQEKYLASY